MADPTNLEFVSFEFEWAILTADSHTEFELVSFEWAILMTDSTT